MQQPCQDVLYRLLSLLPPLTLILASSACTAGRARGSADLAPIEDLPIVWQKSGTYSRIARTIRVVARDPETLARVPISEVPVDFKSQMVLIVGLGPTPSNELGVRVGRVWRQGSQIRVQERRIHPGAESSGRSEPASPWTMAVVPKSDLNVEGFQTRVPAGALAEHPGAR
jgi:hypothetical protein